MVSRSWGGAEAAAESEIEKSTTEKFQQRAGPEEPSGAGRVRSEDPRAEGITAKPEEKLTRSDKSDLRKALGDDLADAVEAGTGEADQKRLAKLKTPEAIKKLAEAFKPKQLARILAAVESETLAPFAKELDQEALTKLLESLRREAGGRASDARVCRRSGPSVNSLERLRR